MSNIKEKINIGNKILIIGSAGSGKTTLSRQLNTLTQLLCLMKLVSLFHCLPLSKIEKALYQMLVK